MMFPDCPAWLDEEGAVRCGLPAKVRHQFIMRSTGGPFSGPPSGRTAAITVIGICRVAGGRITKHWGVPDRFALLAIKVMQQWPMTRLTDAAAPARCPARGGPVKDAAQPLAQAARVLDQDTLDRRRALGQDHPDTLASPDNLAADPRALGEADNDT